MSLEVAEAFFVRIMTDPEIRKKIQEIESEDTDETVAEIVRVGAESGFNFSAEEYRKAVESVMEEQDEDDEF